MNESARNKLVEIIARNGRSIIENPKRCEGLLRDYIGEQRREISVLVMALEERVPLDLLAGSATPRAVLLARLSQRLCDNLALSESAAKWSVNSWALALGTISEQDLKTLETQNARTTSPVTASAVPQDRSIPNQAPLNAPTRTSVKNSYVVSALSGGDFVSIGEAIKAAPAGAKILVRPGLYEEGLIINKQIEIIGDGSVQDIIVRSRNSSCISMQADRAAVRNLTLQCAAGEAGKRVFGVDVQSGEFALQNCDLTSDSLACIAVHGTGTKPLIRDCLVRDSADGGVYFFDSAAGHIEECEIYRNRNANVVIAQNANPTFKNCRIGSGGNAGFWVYEQGLGTIDDCEIFGHTDSEVVATRGGSPVLRGCSIHNSKRSGVSVLDGGSVLLEDCSIYENQGAGVSVDGASIAAVSKCRINGNGKVAVRVKGGSSVRVENSDLRGNLLATWETEHGVFVENIGNLEY